MLLRDLQPKAVWEQFDALTRVPRPSKKEERVIEFLIEFAKSHNIEWQRDGSSLHIILKTGNRQRSQKNWVSRWVR